MIVQFIAIGVNGWHGLYALQAAVVEARQEKGIPTIRLHYMAVIHVLATTKSARIVTLDLALLLALLNLGSSDII
jgi:hypothetical protein